MAQDDAGHEGHAAGDALIPIAFPTPPAPCSDTRLAQAAVVAAQRAIEVAIFDVEVVAQDGAAETQVVRMWKRLLVLAADQLDPERHDLHVAARAGGRHGVLAEPLST
jgi:hypothetical protein